MGYLWYGEAAAKKRVGRSGSLCARRELPISITALYSIPIYPFFVVLLRIPRYIDADKGAKARQDMATLRSQYTPLSLSTRSAVNRVGATHADKKLTLARTHGLASPPANSHCALTLRYNFNTITGTRDEARKRPSFGMPSRERRLSYRTAETIPIQYSRAGASGAKH